MPERSESLSPAEIEAMLIATQKQITAIAYQLEFAVEQIVKLHNRLCDCVTRMRVVMHFGFGDDND